MSLSDSVITIDGEKLPKGYFKNLMEAKDLFYFLAWRDIIVRYKQAFFGVAWAVVRPLLNMIVFTLIFNRIAHLQSGNINYSLFVLAGMLPWQFFAGSITDTNHCLLTNAPLITKTYFPRMVIPLAGLAVHFLDFFIGLVAFLILMPFFGTFIGWSFLLFPIFLAELILLSSGIALWLSAITVRFRDIRFIVPFLVQFGVFISPVGYSSNLIPEKWQWLLYFNPMVGIIDGFRYCFFQETSDQFMLSIISSFAITLFTLVTGYFYFRKKERKFADYI